MTEFENEMSVSASSRLRTPDSISVVDAAVEVLHAAVGQYGRCNLGEIARGVKEDLGGRSRVEPGRDFPCKDSSREVGDHGTQIRSSSINETDHSRVDVPDLVRPRCSNPDLGLLRMNAATRTSPLVPPHEPVPRRGRREDLSHSLRQKSERSSRYVAILVRSHHILNCRNFLSGELAGTRTRARVEVVEITLLFALPGTVSRRGQTEDSQSDTNRERRSGSLDCPKQRDLLTALWNTSPVERHSADLHEHNEESQHSMELLDSAAKDEHFAPEVTPLRVAEVCRDHARGRRLDPASRGGTRNSVPKSMVQIAGFVNELPKSMIVALLNSSRGVHATIVTTEAVAIHP